jgi:hypothetical protein
MARGRFIKPEFWMDEDLARLSKEARLLFIGLWQLADRAGRFEDRPKRIKAEIFPYDDVDADALLTELATQKVHGNGAFIQRYEVSGKRYIQIANFAKHQKCHPKEPDSVLPGPDNVSPRLGNVSPFLDASKPPESESITESESESVGKSESDNGPRLPADEAVEKRIKESKVGDERLLLALVGELEACDPKGRDAASIMTLVTSYDRADGKRVGGVVNPATLSYERVRKSIEDAEALLIEWRKRGTQRTGTIQPAN